MTTYNSFNAFWQNLMETITSGKDVFIVFSITPVDESPEHDYYKEECEDNEVYYYVHSCINVKVVQNALETYAIIIEDDLSFGGYEYYVSLNKYYWFDDEEEEEVWADMLCITHEEKGE